MAELHVIGQILGATGFTSNNLFCKWGVHAGRSWELLEGMEQGQTQLDVAAEGDMAVWSHPIDIHFACKGLAGWPKLHFQVWTQDSHGRNDLCGYGFCHVPTAPGMYDMDCPTWVPQGSLTEQFSALFVGGTPRLTLEEVIYTPGDRFRLQCISRGVIYLQLGVIMKDFEKNHVKFR